MTDIVAAQGSASGSGTTEVPKFKANYVPFDCYKDVVDENGEITRELKSPTLTLYSTLDHGDPVKFYRKSLTTANLEDPEHPCGVSSGFFTGMFGCYEDEDEKNYEADVVLYVVSFTEHLELLKTFVEFHAKDPLDIIKRPIEMNLNNDIGETFVDTLCDFDKEFHHLLTNKVNDEGEITPNYERLWRMIEIANQYLFEDLKNFTHISIIDRMREVEKEDFLMINKPYEETMHVATRTLQVRNEHGPINNSLITDKVFAGMIEAEMCAESESISEKVDD